MADKRLERIKQHPRQVRPEELNAVLEAAGFDWRQKGTRDRFYWRGRQQVTVPQRRPFRLETYVRQALKLLEEGDQ